MECPGKNPERNIGEEPPVHVLPFEVLGVVLDMCNTSQDVKTLENHKTTATCVTFSPDGHGFASCSDDSNITVCDTETWKPKNFMNGHSKDNPECTCQHGPFKHNPGCTVKGHIGRVLSLAFSPNSCCIASAGSDKIVRIWDVETGELKCSLTGHNALVASVAFNRDGSLLATASHDKTVKLWDPSTQQLKCSLEGHQSHVYSVTFSPDGRRIATGSADKTVRIWDVEKGKTETRSLRGHTDIVLCVAFSPDGSQLASASGDNTVKLWDLLGEMPVVQYTLQQNMEVVTCVAFNPNGRSIACAGYSRMVSIWDVKTGKKVERLLGGHYRQVDSVAFSPNGCWLACAQENGTVRLWDFWLEAMLRNEWIVPFMTPRAKTPRAKIPSVA